jgi:CheY-like chemotaxis protein
VSFTVWDTGIGIAAEDLQRLFKPFSQLDSKLSRQYSGTGLGLALVWKMTEMHGGSVAVESTPGQGSRFTIVLPQGDEADDSADAGTPHAATAAPAGPPESGDGRLVLLAEDNEVSARGVRDFLRARGYRVLHARDGGEAVRLTRTERPEIVLMDVQMPGMDGLEAMRQIRAEDASRAVPIVAMTALAMTGDRERCLRAGADLYLSKPIVLRELDEAIRASLPTAETPRTP